MEFTEQVTWAQVQAGDWIYTTPDAVKARDKNGVFLVDTENPRREKGKARKVTDNIKDPDGRYLVFSDATQTSRRNGTAAAYRYLLNDSGNPMPTPTYPPCPVCKSDGPACSTKDGSVAAKWHAKRPERYADVPLKIEARTDAEIDEALAGEPEPVGDKCPKCKGFGVVRKQGPRKHDAYKTLNGSQEATARGNSAPCPMCQGEAVIAA